MPEAKIFLLEHVLACGRVVKYNRRIDLDEWSIFFFFLSQQTTWLNNCCFFFWLLVCFIDALKALNFLELSSCKALESNMNNLLYMWNN